MDFTNQVVIVTGGSRGVGRAAVRMLAERGARVVLSYLERHAAAEEARAACDGLPGEVVLSACDIRERSMVDGLLESTLARWGQVDALINCAGAARYAAAESISDLQWAEVLRANLDGVYHTCQAALRPMMRRRSGRIVNVAALHGVAGGPMQADYSAATGAVLGLTRALAREAAPWGITANAVVPGLIDTEGLGVIPPEQRAWGERVIALRRVARPEEVAAAAVFLASPLASYITGVSLPVDGGWRMA
jgi:3-oxoacyl-[acyl-carrier protein] reductase